MKNRKAWEAWALICRGGIACDADGVLQVFRTKHEAMDHIEPGDSLELVTVIREKAKKAKKEQGK